DASVRDATGDKKARAHQVGLLLASRAKDAGITAAVFDRGGYAYHGRVAALADGARGGGLTLWTCTSITNPPAPAGTGGSGWSSPRVSNAERNSDGSTPTRR